jgi:hypothetical protein
MGLLRFAVFPTRKELLAAMLAAKVEGLVIPHRASGGRFVHGHAANGVNCHDECAFPTEPVSLGGNTRSAHKGAGGRYPSSVSLAAEPKENPRR